MDTIVYINASFLHQDFFVKFALMYVLHNIHIVY